MFTFLFYLTSGSMGMRGIVDILNAEQDANTDEDLLVYALTLVNKVENKYLNQTYTSFQCTVTSV